jgi:tRNA A-37 threonylcarbamoyl transferase component Bud32
MNHLEDRYEIIGPLGTGATSRVDKARDRVIGRTVALKTFRHAFGSGDLQMEFLREAQIIGQLTHPFIVGLHDVGTNQDHFPYLVMEYVDGKTLEKMLDAGPLPLERVALWGADLAAALQCAHERKIIHGDLKPANVLITADGQVKLGDFGIARFATQVSASGRVLGTPAYLSPEQILGHKQDTRSDLFSLGVMLYEMTTGVRPFGGTSVSAVCAQIISTRPLPPSQHNRLLPPAFDHVVLRCLAKDPAQRYADAASLRSDLLPFVRRTVHSPLTSGPWWRRPLQSGDLRVLAGVLCVLALFGAAGAAHLRSSNSTPPAESASYAPVVAPALRALAATPAPEPANPVITVSTIDVGGAGASAPSVVPGTSSGAPLAEPVLYLQERRPSDLASPAAQPAVRNAARSSAALAKAKNSAPAQPSESAALAALPVALPTAKLVALAPAPAQPVERTSPAKAALHVEVTAAGGTETLSVFDGEALLLSTPLQNLHAAEATHFDYPVSAGHHSFHVVVGRPGEKPSLEKTGTAELSADASNVLAIHVVRRTRLLLKHETTLEIAWPASHTPHLEAGIATAPAGGASLR